MLHLKRFKPFAVLVSLFLFGLLYMLSTFLVNYENKVVIKFFRPVPSTRNDVEFHAGINKHLSLIRQGLRKTLIEYEVSRMNLGKRFADAVNNASLNNLQLVGKISKQHIVCNNELFLLIQVHSLPESFMSRQAIRLSWGNTKHFIGNLKEKKAKLRWVNYIFQLS